MDDVARADGDDLVVVAGAEPVALLVTGALLRAGHTVVGLVEHVDALRALIVDGEAALGDALDGGRYRITDDPRDCADFAVGLVTEPPETDATLSPVEHFAAALAPHLRQGALLVVSSATAENAGVVVDATVELLTGLRAGRDYGLAHLFAPVPQARLIVSGVDAASAGRAQEWLTTVGFPVMPILPVAAAEIVATLLARAEQPPEGPPAHPQ